MKRKRSEPHIPRQERHSQPIKKQEAPDNQELSVGVQQMILQEQSLRISPLPHPDELREYDKILPGAANRIITLAEEEARERRIRDGSIVRTDNFVSIGGLALGFICFLLPLGFSTYLAVHGFGDMAKWMLGTSVVSVIPSFLKVIRKSNK